MSPTTVDLAHAIKLPGLRPSDLLNEHADELRELDEDCESDVEAEVRCTAAQYKRRRFF
jgi:hypothetical protein